MIAQDTASQFRTTHWSMIVRARDGGEDLNRLLQVYRGPIYAFARRSGFGHADADDLTQQFIQDVVIDRDLVARADASRGRFRSFVRTALRRFIIDRIRQNGHFKPTDPEAFELVISNDANDAEREFDQQWASLVLDLAMHRLEDDCLAAGMEVQWRVFEARIVRPAVDGTEPASFESLQREFNIADAQKIYSMLQTMKRKTEAVIRAVIEETVEDLRDVDVEYGDLRRFLA